MILKKMVVFVFVNVIIVLLVGVLTLLFICLKRKYSYWDRQGIKTVPGFNYLTGHMNAKLFQTQLANLINGFYETSNDAFSGIYLFLKPNLLVRDPELIRSILIKDFSYFVDREFPCDEEHEPLSGHLFALPGQKWRNLRAKLSPTFTSGKLKAMFATLVKSGSTLQSFLENVANSNGLLNIKEISSSYAINVIASVAFGIEVDTINDPNNEFRVCGRTITTPTLKGSLSKIMILMMPKLASIFGVRFDDLSVEQFIVSVVKQNLEYRERNNVSRKDFFQLLIQLRNSGTVELDDEWETIIKGDDSEKLLTLNEMAAQVFIFFFAGFETSSSTLTFCLYELAKNHEIQQKVHDEIDRVLAQYNGQITYESVSAMQFLGVTVDGLILSIFLHICCLLVVFTINVQYLYIDFRVFFYRNVTIVSDSTIFESALYSRLSNTRN